MVTPSSILNSSELLLINDFDDQVQHVLQTVRLSRNEVERLRQLYKDLQSLFETNWQGCEIIPFGSIVTGLGIKTSDVDCHISVPNWSRNPGENCVIKAKKLLCQYPHIFEEVFAICGAKVPIVKFFHVPTQRHCDINFKSPTGVKNSMLIAFLLQMDKRALPLAILIKWWSKVHKLTGTNKVASYAMTLLVIYYLQYKYILPSISLLQETVEPLIIDHWNISFDDSYRYLSNNDQTLYELLGGFFKYYSMLDYQNNVISVYTGCEIDRQLFTKPEELPDKFRLYKSNMLKKVCNPFNISGNLCVQDPFEHARNCTVAVHKSLFDKMMKCINHAAKRFDECQSNEFLRAIYIASGPYGKPFPRLERVKKKIGNFTKGQANHEKAHMPNGYGYNHRFNVRHISGGVYSLLKEMNKTK